MINITSRDIKKVQKRLKGNSSKAQMAIYRALNRTATNLKTNASKKAREIYRVKAKDINQTFSIQKANKSSLAALVVSKSKSMGLEKFKINAKDPQKRPKAFKAAVKKSSGAKEIVRAFVANINGIKVFHRVGQKRLPIQRLYGPPVPQMVNNREVRDFVEKQAVETYNKRLDHEINRIMEGN